jgi:hypothetical protein
MGGGAVVGIVALNYHRIVSGFVRYAGAGADCWSVMAMILVALGAVAGLVFALNRLRAGKAEPRPRESAQDPVTERGTT